MHFFSDWEYKFIVMVIFHWKNPEESLNVYLLSANLPNRMFLSFNYYKLLSHPSLYSNFKSARFWSLLSLLMPINLLEQYVHRMNWLVCWSDRKLIFFFSFLFRFFSFLSDQSVELRHPEATKSFTRKKGLEHTSGDRNEMRRYPFWWPLDLISSSLKLHSLTAKITRKDVFPHTSHHRLICSAVFWA